MKKMGKFKPIMHGVFLPDALPRRNIVPLAWGGKYPAQVRVKQFYKFNSIPWILFKDIFYDCGSRTCLQLTTQQTLDLVTKFIVNTRVKLSHRVIEKLSEFEKNDAKVWIEETIQRLRCSMFW